MGDNSTVFGYLLGGIPLVIGGLGLVRAMEWFGLPPIAAGIGVVTAAVGVAETFGKVFRWVVRSGRAIADRVKHPQSKKYIYEMVVTICMVLSLLSGPIYFYLFELQFISREQWLIHVATLDPILYPVYMVGGPLFTGLIVVTRYGAITYCTERLKPRIVG